MECTCCQPINDLDKAFDKKRADKERKEYLENGIEKRVALMLTFFKNNNVLINAVLDVGCGIGALHHELILSGIAQKAVGIEVSQAYIDAANYISQKKKHAEKVIYQKADFAVKNEELGGFDLVILDRVICCYPEYSALLQNVMEHSRKYILLSYPKNSIWVRLYYITANWVRRIRKSEFFTYFHEPEDVQRLLRSGYSVQHSTEFKSWQIQIWCRD